MKISRVIPMHVGQFLYVRIETECGLVGFGESGTWGHIEASKAALEKFGEYLVGQDPRRIEYHWNVMQRFSHFRGTAINGAVSAVDIALWDILGKKLGVPVWQLLGGRYRDAIRVYGHVYAPTIEETVAECRRLKDAGFTAIGHLNPFLDESEDDPFFKTQMRKLDDAAENVRLFREAVGPDVDLLLELHRRLTPAEAVTLASKVEAYTPMWIEDPLRPELYDELPAVANSTTIPVATGERFGSPFEFQTQFRRGGVRYARTSVCVCGGITGARKIAGMAETLGIEIAPHNPLSPISLAACLQLATATPNFAIQEYPTGFENLTMQSGARLLGADLVKSHPLVENGFIRVSDAPGIGVELHDDVEQLRAPLKRKVSMRHYKDGSPMDQ
ncbi:MAG TPA: mandelate racemase/muconate lactonizing enzyme family protein [Bordetella sp.]|nr:mandelate racemase/muconate lactonizing enzyme family protein [Bordetella sp.]